MRHSNQIGIFWQGEISAISQTTFLPLLDKAWHGRLYNVKEIISARLHGRDA